MYSAILLTVLAASSPWMEQVRAAKPVFASLATDLGDIVVELDTARAPIASEAFTGLASGEKAWTGPDHQITQRPLYDGTIFHRVIPGFLIEGGDPLGNGTGGPGYPVAPETVPGQKDLHPVRGMVGLAHTPDPSNGGSQFFILVGDAPWLEGKATLFGKVVAGMDVVDQIVSAPRGPGDRPLKPVSLLKVTLSAAAPRAGSKGKGKHR